MNTFEVLNENTVRMNISGNSISGSVLISKCDLEIVKSHSWYIKDSTNGINYVACKKDGKTCKLHRLLLNATERTQIVDHINRDTFDNRRENLRIVTSTENNLNCRKSKNNTSGRTGVFFKKGQGNRSDLWITQWNEDGKHKCKCFSIRDLGYDEAFKMASEFRSSIEKKMNIMTDK